MASGKCMIIGLGDIGLQLVRSLSRSIGLICVDTSAELLEVARQLRSEGLETFQGDATSRLFLERAGAGEVDTILITTTSEDVNIEVARVLREHFSVPRVVALGITRGGIRTLEKLDVEVEGIFTASATFLRNRVEFKSKTVQGIGLGKNEILEVEVHGHSRLAGKSLASLNPRSWRVGIVYRDGNIVIPGGDTVLRAKDRVVLLGDPKVLKTVTDLLTFRFTHFPLEFGDTLVAYLPAVADPAYLAELDYLLSVFPLEKALFICRRPESGLEAELHAAGDPPARQGSALRGGRRRRPLGRGARRGGRDRLRRRHRRPPAAAALGRGLPLLRRPRRAARPEDPRRQRRLPAAARRRQLSLRPGRGAGSRRGRLPARPGDDPGDVGGDRLPHRRPLRHPLGLHRLGRGAGTRRGPAQGRFRARPGLPQRGRPGRTRGESHARHRCGAVRLQPDGCRRRQLARRRWRCSPCCAPTSPGTWCGGRGSRPC